MKLEDGRAFEEALEERRREERAKPAVLRHEWPDPSALLTYAEDASAKLSHGRIERRECWALSDPYWRERAGAHGTIGEPWPGLAQLAAIRRWRTIRGKTTFEVAYLITSLPAHTHPAARLLELNRSYWGIENRLHYVRDETLGEDRSQVRSGAAPQAMAGLRNLLLALLRRKEPDPCAPVNIAARLRTFAARPAEAICFVLSARSSLRSRAP